MDVTREDAIKNVCQNLRYRLMILGWNVDRLSKERPIVPRNTIYRILRGENLGLAHQLFSIAEVLATTVDSLIREPSTEIIEKLSVLD